jgi:hypothetical protein
MVVPGNWRILAGAGWRDKSWRSYFSTAYTIVQVSCRSVFARQQKRFAAEIEPDAWRGKIHSFHVQPSVKLAIESRIAQFLASTSEV